MSAGASRPKKKSQRPARPAGEIRKPYPVWLVTTAAFLLPGSGQMLNGFPVRGIIMQFFMIVLGFVTYKISSPDISFIGRFAGGIFVYVFSVIDANTVAKRAMAAWERMGEGGGGAGSGPTSSGRRPNKDREPQKGAKPSRRRVQGEGETRQRPPVRTKPTKPTNPTKPTKPKNSTNQTKPTRPPGEPPLKGGGGVRVALAARGESTGVS